MADSAFWRDLEARFRALQPSQGDGLRAEWYSIDRRWLLRGAPSASVFRRFKQTAAYAAKMKVHPRRATSALDFWLGMLKREPDTFRVEGQAVVKEKGKTRRGEYGVIARVCEVSADYCQKLADQASKRPAETTLQSGKSLRAPRELRPGTLARLLPQYTSELSRALRERGPDIRTSRERVELEDKFRTELGSVKAVIDKGCAALEDLRKEFPTFELWHLLSTTEQRELLTDEFKPRAYARTLVMRKYGLTNPETVKKDRQKLRRAKQ